MTGERSARLELPLLAPGQAQKEMYHNEALLLIDGLLHAAAEGVADGPPAATQAGDCWLVGPAPIGDWAGRPNAVAIRTEGGWRFAAPRAGFRILLKSRESYAEWSGTAWQVGTVRGARLMVGGQQVVGERGAAVAAPVGGATVDGEARAALVAVLDRLRAHGLIA